MKIKCFTIPSMFVLQGTVYLYYGLTNFYQNHRRYVRSRDDNQLHGDEMSPDSLQSDCEPYKKRKLNASVEYGIAPCGAIANSLFNGRLMSTCITDCNLCESSWSTTNPTKSLVSLGSPKISLCIHTVWLESSVCAIPAGKCPVFLHADWSDCQMCRLIWVFAVWTWFCGFCHAPVHFFVCKIWKFNTLFISSPEPKAHRRAYSIQYSSRGFSISHSSQWADLFAPCNPTQGSTPTLPVILWYSPCDPPASPCVSTQMGGITGGYKILILSTQVKQGKVHRILITPLQSHSKLHWKTPVFPLQCFHRNGWNHRGVKFFNPSTQFYYPLGWEGKWKNPQAE